MVDQLGEAFKERPSFLRGMFSVTPNIEIILQIPACCSAKVELDYDIISYLNFVEMLICFYRLSAHMRDNCKLLQLNTLFSTIFLNTLAGTHAHKYTHTHTISYAYICIHMQ